jgi:hypothetical protein
MNKVLFILLFLSAAFSAITIKYLTDIEKERQQLKQDVRQLCNDIDDYGDIDTYTGSDHFERLYKWSHNIK